jgi:hypothetical protein
MPAKKRIIHPIQLDPELDEKIRLAAEKLALPKAEVMRLAMAIGLEHLRRINYDLAAHLCQTPEPKKYFEALKVADEGNAEFSHSTPAPTVPTKYPTGKRRPRKES